MNVILLKELKTFFGAFGVYIIATGFVVICSLFLWFFDNDFNVFNLGNAHLSSYFFIAPWVLMFLIPALTMGLMAEEKQMGTLDWLRGQPISTESILLGKYLAILVIIVFILIPTLIYLPTLQHFSLDKSIDSASILCGYLGLFFLASLFASIGLYISSISSNQVIAYVVTVIVCFLLYFGFQGIASYNLMGNFDYYIRQIGADYHLSSFVKGIIDSRDLIYFIGLDVLFLFMANLSFSEKK